MAGPLDGIRVIDVSAMVSGPLATMILGDQGADVIKVEPPGVGDLVRAFGTRRAGVPAIFATTNRNKRSLVLDLKSERGRALLERLVAGADVFVQNFRPGAVERMGIGEPALRAIKPDLVYVSISGFGERGPYVGKRVYDPVVQALSGLATIQADAATGRPRMMRTIVPDKLTAVTAAQAITAALVARERTGVGQHVRLAMLDATVAFLWPEGMASHTFLDVDEEDWRPNRVRDLIYETADGYITVGVVSDAEWRGLVRVLEQPALLEDERFRTPSRREKNAEARMSLTADALRTRTSREWLERLDAEEVPCAPVVTRDELVTHPQIVANELLVESTHPHAGRMRQPRPAARFGTTPAAIRRPAPVHGEHTDEVLAELGCSSSEIAELRSARIVS